MKIIPPGGESGKNSFAKSGSFGESADYLFTLFPSSNAFPYPVSTAGDSARDGRTIVSSRCSSTSVGFLQ